MKSPVVGGIYTDVKDGLAVTGNAGSSKVGTAEVKGYVGVVAMGDASIQTRRAKPALRGFTTWTTSRNPTSGSIRSTIIVYGD